MICAAALFCIAGAASAAEAAGNETGGNSGRYGMFAKNMRPNEPIYFSVGGHGGLNARFQLSFKYLLTDGLFARDGHLFFAYTQTSLWDLHSRSVPFYDTSYRPSLLYEVDKESTTGRRPGSLPWMQAGIEHESNGRAGDESRSMNIFFVRPRFFLGDPNDTNLQFAPKVWAYLGASGNSGMEKYRGYADLLAIFNMGRDFGFLANSQIAATLRKGSGGHYGSYQVDAAYPLGSTFYLHLQYFNGYGETILDYNKRDTQYRMGMMFVSW